jgi:hypothetical protein
MAQVAVNACRNDVMMKTKGLCFYCGEEANSVDHFIPLTSGGKDEIDNLVPACKSCNNSKKHHSIEQWRNFHRRKLALKSGIPWFHAGQYKWLKEMGFDVLSVAEVPGHKFWFEIERELEAVRLEKAAQESAQ